MILAHRRPPTSVNLLPIAISPSIWPPNPQRIASPLPVPLASAVPAGINQGRGPGWRLGEGAKSSSDPVGSLPGGDGERSGRVQPASTLSRRPDLDQAGQPRERRGATGRRLLRERVRLNMYVGDVCEVADVGTSGVVDHKIG